MRRVAGTSGALMVVRSSETEPWRVVGLPEPGAADSAVVDVVTVDAQAEDAGASTSSSASVAGEKRERSASVGEGPEAKRVRVSPEGSPENKGGGLSCSAPQADPRVTTLLEKLDSMDSDKTEEASLAYLGAGDVFLTEGWRDRWCSCTQV